MSSTQESNSDQTVTLTSQCLCKSHTFTCPIPAASLPLDASCCHCTSCRHSTGGMYTMDIDWPGDTSAIRSSALAVFDFTSKVKILFCPTCGTPMFFESRYDGPEGKVNTGVFSGTLTTDAEIKNLVRITDHIFVGDTVDGGASVWLRQPNGDGTVADRYAAGKGAGSGKSETLPEDWPSSPPSVPPSVATEVPVWCKCRGVNFVLRPDFSDTQTDKLPFFVDPESKKLLASFDACNSCRSAVGVDIVNWTFACLRHIYFAGSSSDTLPQTARELKEAVVAADGKRDARLGTLACWESSPDVQRYFCSRCSATVFYACDDRQDMVDIAVGLLGSETGARAEDVLTWALGGKATWRQDVVGTWREGLFDAVEREGEKFRVERGLEVNFARRRREDREKEEKKD
ncbi:Mss4-like protein [Coniochaeta sp. 2T2.1]|nr:Mss4-like protein [Coniochaeta sp. 2T2.1]